MFYSHSTVLLYFVFSPIRCVIAELFTEGHAPFDLSQLLSYCTQGSDSYVPDANLKKIEDDNIRVSEFCWILMYVI